MPYGIIEMVQLLVHGAQDLQYANDIQRLGRYADMHVHVNDGCMQQTERRSCSYSW